jgi:hypothetical protein
LLCMLWEEQGGMPAATHTLLMNQLVHDIMERNFRRSQQWKSDGTQSSEQAFQESLLHLGQLALHGFSKNSLLFQSTTVEQLCKNPRTLTELGFLNEDNVSSRRFGSQPVYYFLHLSLMEYAAAYTLVHSKTAASQFNGDPRLDMIWLYAAGILGEAAAPLLDVIVSAAIRTKRKRLRVLALHCLRESRAEATIGHVLQPMLSEIVDLSHTAATLDDVCVLLSLSSTAPQTHALVLDNSNIADTQDIECFQVCARFTSLLASQPHLTSIRFFLTIRINHYERV